MSLSNLAEWAAAGADTLDAEQTASVLRDLDIALDAAAAPGVELRVALEQDSLFGPVVAFSFGRMAMDIWEDVTYRIVPLTLKDARVMVREPRAASKLLAGYRGLPAPAAAGIEALVLKLSHAAQEHPEIAEIELDPVMAYPDRLVAKAASIRLNEP
jgi:hypothetical protein